ncbi:hypothetical protein V6L78_13700 [Pseudomonas canadensis]|uniref:hypothetical protein n=1 Tax=Pseudomonas canadensis TaxID=915099 RepID=UPI0030D12AEE
MEWILANKEWLFSGVAIAMPVALISWLVSRHGGKQTQKSGNNSTNIQIGGNFKIGGNKDDK